MEIHLRPCCLKYTKNLFHVGCSYLHTCNLTTVVFLVHFGVCHKANTVGRPDSLECDLLNLQAGHNNVVVSLSWHQSGKGRNGCKCPKYCRHNAQEDVHCQSPAKNSNILCFIMMYIRVCSLYFQDMSD